jgi:hypothetical protein
MRSRCPSIKSRPTSTPCTDWANCLKDLLAFPPFTVERRTFSTRVFLFVCSDQREKVHVEQTSG